MIVADIRSRAGRGARIARRRSMRQRTAVVWLGDNDDRGSEHRRCSRRAARSIEEHTCTARTLPPICVPMCHHRMGPIAVDGVSRNKEICGDGVGLDIAPCEPETSCRLRRASPLCARGIAPCAADVRPRPRARVQIGARALAAATWPPPHRTRHRRHQPPPPPHSPHARTQHAQRQHRRENHRRPLPRGRRQARRRA